MNNMQPNDMEDNLEGKKTGKEEYDNSTQHPHYLPPGRQCDSSHCRASVGEGSRPTCT